MNPTDEQLVRWGAEMCGWMWEPEYGCYRVPHDDREDFQDPNIGDLNFAVQVAEAFHAKHKHLQCEVRIGRYAECRAHGRKRLYDEPVFDEDARDGKYARALLTALYRLHEELEASK